MKRFAFALVFIGLTSFFGGVPGGVIGLGIVLLRASGAAPRLYWLLGVFCLIAAPISVLVQGLPSGAVNPSFGPHHWAAQLLVGIAMASLSFAAFLEIPRIRSQARGPT